MINSKTTSKKLDRSIKKENLRALDAAELDGVAGGRLSFATGPTAIGGGVSPTTLAVRNDLRNASLNLALRAVCSGCHGC